MSRGWGKPSQIYQQPSSEEIIRRNKMHGSTIYPYTEEDGQTCWAIKYYDELRQWVTYGGNTSQEAAEQALWNFGPSVIVDCTTEYINEYYAKTVGK